MILDRNKLNEIQLNYFKKIFEKKEQITEIIENFDIVKEQRGFIFSRYFIDNYMKYATYDEFIDAYVAWKLKEAHQVGINSLVNNWVNRQLLKDTGIMTLKGEYVKSAGEMVIANFLYCNGLDYSYE